MPEETVGDVIARVLRQNIGVGTTLTLREASEKTAIKERTIRAHISGDTKPGGEALLEYLKHLPLTEAQEILMLSGIRIAARAEHSERTEFEILHSVGRFIAQLSEALEDNRICPVEARELREGIVVLVSELNSLHENLESKL